MDPLSYVIGYKQGEANGSSGSGDINVVPLTITENGLKIAPSGKAYSPISVNVENSYNVEDEGKVVSNGALVAQTAHTEISANGTYDMTLNDEVTVNVSGGASAVVQPLSVAQNGTYNPPSGVDGYAPVTVNVSGAVTSDNDLLFHFDDGFNNSGKTPAIFTNTTGLSISSEQSKFGGNSLKSGTTQVKDNAALNWSFAFGSSDFTLDFWIYPTNIPSSGSIVPLAFSYKSIGVYLKPGKIEFDISKNGSSWHDPRDVSVEMRNDAWYHIALVRSGSDIYGFVDGVKVETINVGTDALAPVTAMTVGSNTYSNGDRRFAGYIDELRLKIGTAVWTDDFTPPTEPYI